jgi:hypothetical protein
MWAGFTEFILCYKEPENFRKETRNTKYIFHKPLGMLRVRWEDNIKMDPNEISCEDKRWVKLVHNGVQRTILIFAALKHWVILSDNYLVDVQLFVICDCFTSISFF